MKKINYTMNHKADEAYMAKMCHAGWAATSLVEGVCTFESCRSDQYIVTTSLRVTKNNLEFYFRFISDTWIAGSVNTPIE